MAERLCGWCGATTVGLRSDAMYCSKQCANKAFNRRRVADGRVKTYRDQHKVERAEYMKTYQPQYVAANRETLNATWRNNCHIRRARARDLPAEKIDCIEIFERDNWTCGVCHEPVDPALSHPDPMAASLDHIVALANGGHHVKENVQCSHWICNVSKGVKVIADTVVA